MINSPYRKYEPFFGNWYLKEYLGSGSFGQVFLIEKKVQHRKSGPQSALKIISLPQNQAEVEELRQNYEVDDQTIFQHYENIVFRISREIELMSKLRGNPHIVDYEDHQVIRRKGEIGWDILIRMEYLTPLPKKLKEQKVLSWQEIGKIGRDICQALEICQEHQILHRDIKPANIMVNAAGEYKLGDFGISRSIETKAEADFQLTYRVGTLSYMAPEVYNLTGNLSYGITADLYSLGLVLYRLLNNNRLPFMRQGTEYKLDNNEERESFVRRMKGEELPPPCQAPPALAAIILRACAFDIAQRYQTPRQMCNDLERLLAEENWSELPELPAPETVVPNYAEEETIEIPSGSLYQTNNPVYHWERRSKKKTWLKNTLVSLLGVAAVLVSVWLICMVLNQRNLQYVEAQEIALNGSEVTLGPGEQEQLDYSIYPHNAVEQEVKWSSSNPGVVSVSNRGKLTALAAGESIIVVSNGEVSGACRVTVTEDIIATSKIALLTQNLPQEITAGAKLQFKARVLPVNASNKLVNWQVSDSAIADITADGCLTALKPGSVRVTAQTGEFSASWDLQIVEGLNFWQDQLNLAVGESEVLLPLPKNSQLNYFSQDESIATVDQRGKVTAVGMGQTEIVAANSDFSASCPVVVTANQVENLTLNLSSLNLVVGEKRNLTAEVKPANTRVRWSSNNLLVAMVNQQGQVTANSRGTALITAQAEDLEVGCQVTVEAAQIAVEKVILTPEVLNLETGNQSNLTLEILPENADDKTVIWSSKNANIAVVSNGKVTARDPGVTSITATVAGKSANCLVTVLPTNLAFNVESTVSGEISDLTGGSQIRLKDRSVAYPISENVVLMSIDSSQSFNLSDLYVGMQVILGLDDEKQVVQIIVN